MNGLLSDAAQHQHVDARSATILHLISNHLKMAPHRLGGTGRGCHVPAASSPVEHNEAAASDASDSDNGGASDSASEAAASDESADD